MELKNCPFCGGEVTIALIGESNDLHWFVTRGTGENACKCRVFMESDPFAIGEEGEGEDKRNNLITAWNTRHDGCHSHKRQKRKGKDNADKR